MRPDQISLTAKSDPLICLYGESYLQKHKRKQMNVVASNRIREMARLKLALQTFTTITNFIDFLKPEMYNNFVAASKIICGFDSETRTFIASSLALHLGTNLKFLCDVARKAITTKDPLFSKLENAERDQKLKDIADIRDMFCSHWCNDISSLANKALNESKSEKPKLVPLTADIRCFNTYITMMAAKAYEKLQKNEDIERNYKLLAECTLCLVLVFNRKRIGEVQFLDIPTYEKNFFVLNQEECLSSLSEFEKNMSSFFKRVVVYGKGSKPVPILFTKQMQVYVDELLKIRNESNIVPKSNKYIFANPGSTDRWMTGASVLRKFAKQCGAKNPELLTSTKFRKQIATILQLMNFKNDEMEQIARFMGHTEKTHKEFYRLTDDVYQTAKVAKVLLLLNAGKGNEFKGKSLDEIQVAQDLVDFDEKNRRDERQDNRLLSPQSFPEQYDGNVVNNEAVNLTDISSRSSEVKTSNSKRGNRTRWTASEKKLVLKFFKNHIVRKAAPKKEECISFIRKNGNLFNEKDWLRIKTLVYNTYRLLH